MYILSIMAVVVGTCIMSLLSNEGLMSVLEYVDGVSLIMLLIFTLPMLIASHLLKDFNNAFRLSTKKSEIKNISEIKRAIEAVDLVMKVLLGAGAFIAVFLGIMILHELDDSSTIGPKMSIGMLSLVYALAIDLFLLPLKARLKVRLHEFIEAE